MYDSSALSQTIHCSGTILELARLESRQIICIFCVK
uniref:Uncharacterized protein n=1 Tax=Rhizophora mucronata TaxID=61149 RepID=A0A2P2P3G0_RHIMU